MLIVLIGFLSGIVGGMGIGGGTILIPSLVFFIGTKQHLAQSVNLISFIPTSLVAIIIHLRNKRIETNVSIKLILAGCLGAIIGSLLAVQIDSQYLKRYFGIFLLLMGLYEMFSKHKQNNTSKTNMEK